MMRQFHDRAVVASLKQGQPALTAEPMTGIPRPRGRGLIEATSGPINEGEQAGIPRPRGRGLIEALERTRFPHAVRQFHDRAVVASLKRCRRARSAFRSSNSTTARSWPH